MDEPSSPSVGAPGPARGAQQAPGGPPGAPGGTAWAARGREAQEAFEPAKAGGGGEAGAPLLLPSGEATQGEAAVEPAGPDGGGVAGTPEEPLPAIVVAPAATLAERSGVDVFRRAARSPNTLAAYRGDWARFAAWCEAAGVAALPAAGETLAAYLADAATEASTVGRSVPYRYAPATLARWVATINKAHDLAGARPPGRDPAVSETLAGIRRLRATPPARKAPLLLADLETILAAIPATGWPAAPGGIRNRALLVMGWVGAFRRAELVALRLGDIILHPEDGLHVLVRQSKTDQAAQGRTYALPYARQPMLCAPCAWTRWSAVLAAWEGADGGPGGRAGLMRAVRTTDAEQHICRQGSVPATEAGGDPDAPAFRAVRANGTLGDKAINGHVLNEMVKRAAAAAGFDPERIGGHSLRAGFVTQAFRSGADAHAIMRQTGHRDPKTLEIYARESAPLVGNAVTQIGL